MDVRVLAFHAGYQCRHAGACCTSSWPIPIEADRHARVNAALASGALRTMSDVGAFVEPVDDDDEAPVLLATSHGRCVFHDPAGRCVIHTALGHDALPLACRQFPRVSVIDPRGVSATLSHYCPTACRLLDDDSGADASIVVNTPRFPSGGEYVGLDARTALPPLLRPGMLMDWESWWELEGLTVDTLLASGASAGHALDRVRGVVTALQAWRPGDGSLIGVIHDAFSRTAAEPAPASSGLIAAAFNAVPAQSRSSAQWTSSESTSDQAARRFLAAHAFANWTMHLGDGLMAWLRSIETAHAFVTAGAGVRHADLVLRHLIDPKAFASKLSRVPF